MVRICTVCKMSKQRINKQTMQPESAVQRYSLYRRLPIEGDPSGKTVQAGMGGIDLCDDCWERECKPSWRKKRKDAKYQLVGALR